MKYLEETKAICQQCEYNSTSLVGAAQHATRSKHRVKVERVTTWMFGGAEEDGEQLKMFPGCDSSLPQPKLSG